MKKIAINETMNINGGKTYYCPFNCNKSGGYWSVYWHCISNGCFKKNSYLNGIWKAGKWCITTGLTNGLCNMINMATAPSKH